MGDDSSTELLIIIAAPQISGDMTQVLLFAALASRDAGAELTGMYSQRAAESSTGVRSATEPSQENSTQR